MNARLVRFGEIEVEGERYTHDVVIDGGKVRKRKKGPSKQFREKFGHTPLSAGEKIPWGGERLIVGTGAHGALPVMDQVLEEAKRRGIEVIAKPTLEACRLLEEVKKGQAYDHPALYVLTADYWESIADYLSKAGWSLGCVSALDSDGRTIWIAGCTPRRRKSFCCASG
jgi:Uncharacterized conserved protein